MKRTLGLGLAVLILAGCACTQLAKSEYRSSDQAWKCVDELYAAGLGAVPSVVQ